MPTEQEIIASASEGNLPHEILVLRKSRGEIKRQLTISEKLLASIDFNTDLEALNLEERLERHLNLWDKFDKIQTALDDNLVDEAAVELDSERTSFENRYYRIGGLFKKHLKRSAVVGSGSVSNISQSIANNHLQSESSVPISESTSSNSIPAPISNLQVGRLSAEGQNQEVNEIQNQEQLRFNARFELPKLQTPTFHGSFDTWLTFHDSFKSMCHDNPSIPSIQKFHYLKACIKDEAAEVIASLETTGQNYQVAWDLLKARFDNRKYIVESHVRALVEIPSVSKEFTVRALLDNVQKRIRALRALEQPVDTWDTLLIFIIREKLNNYTREKWDESVSSTRLPSFKDFVSFLEHRALMENTQSTNKVNPSNYNKNQPSKGNSHSRLHPRSSQACMATAVGSKAAKSTFACYLCSGQHQLYICEQFLNMTPLERYEAVKKASLCHNCLLGNHRTGECRRAPCHKCQKPHNILLHFEKSTQQEAPQSITTALVSFQSPSPTQVVLGTAIIDILDSQGQYRHCRAFLDSCSQCCSITDSLAISLGLQKKPIQIQLKGAQNIQSQIKYSASTKVKSRYDNEFELDLNFLVFKEISDAMPVMPINRNSLKVPEEIFLADPEFHKSSNVDILIGAEYFFELLLVGKIRIPNQTAVFQETVFGWIFSGRYNHPKGINRQGQISPIVSCNLIKFHDLPILWELGDENSAKLRSEEEQIAESHYLENVKRLDSGRYEVKLPFNDKKDLLGDSRNTAFQRFYALERKFVKNSDLQQQYVECFQGYMDEGHMSLLCDQEASKAGYYLPHHAVIKEDSLTTKTRVVFDGSAKSSTGISLNDTFLVGPTVQDDLFSIVTRFRTHPVVLTADIQQMYRQIRVAENDRLYQKVLWRKSPDEPIKTYSLNTVTFGTACAPFLAIRTLHKLADDEQASFPEAAKILKRDFYVDDLQTGARSIKEARQLRDDLIHLLQKGGFNIRKWASNKPELLCEFSSEVSNEYMSLDPSSTIKALGLHWDPKSDSILYSVNLSESDDHVTKRSILSQCAKLFDPLGLVGPVVVVGKMLIQQLWKQQLGWDERVPVEIRDTWRDYKKQLPLLNSVKYQRCITLDYVNDIQLHGFCDASEKAYGACLYLRSTDDKGRHHCELICAKSRVAPLRTTTLPKLELCAATLLAQLYKSTIRSLQLEFSKTVFWSDSTIALNWINTPPHSLMTFMANRVSEIQAATQASDWRHVPTRDNPADCISRGQSARDFLNNLLWKHGPQWLSCHDETWPQLDFQLKDVPGKRASKSVITLKIIQFENNLLTKYSNFKKLQRVVAYVLRFVNNSRIRNPETTSKGVLSQKELKSALQIILKLTQAESFSSELQTLLKGENVNPKSSLFSLTPFLDQGVIRVGGRLNRAEIPESQKHPIVLPKNHHITKLIIRDEHINRLHAGTNATLYGVRELYWPIDGRNTTRFIIRQCVTCFRAKPREVNYLMGDLPKSRLSFTRAFLNVGVDFCGPFYTKEHRHRNRTKVKTYVAVFVCFATKAIHLELASDLTTQAFIACLKRFFARRGVAQLMQSDNAKNFVGTHNELRALINEIHSVVEGQKVQEYLTDKGVSWRFIPPRAPHFGGLWEAAVKSFKNHFIRIAGNSLLTYEQLHTYVAEIEAILNSRPLTPLSSDPTDLLPLTPGHFLIGTSMTSSPQEDLRKIPACRLNCWSLAQQMSQHFWERWHKEYLNEMISRSKWKVATNQNNIAIGTLVVVKEDNLPPMKWNLARIIEVHPGRDGIIRAVTLRGASNTFKRALKTLYPLPID